MIRFMQKGCSDVVKSRVEVGRFRQENSDIALCLVIYPSYSRTRVSSLFFDPSGVNLSAAYLDAVCPPARVGTGVG